MQTAHILAALVLDPSAHGLEKSAQGGGMSPQQLQERQRQQALAVQQKQELASKINELGANASHNGLQSLTPEERTLLLENRSAMSPSTLNKVVATTKNLIRDTTGQDPTSNQADPNNPMMRPEYANANDYLNALTSTAAGKTYNDTARDATATAILSGKFDFPAGRAVLQNTMNSNGVDVSDMTNEGGGASLGNFGMGVVNGVAGGAPKGLARSVNWLGNKAGIASDPNSQNSGFSALDDTNTYGGPAAILGNLTGNLALMPNARNVGSLRGLWSGPVAASTLPRMGTLATMGMDAATWGGSNALSQLGNGRPWNVKELAAQTAVGGAFPLFGKAVEPIAKSIESVGGKVLGDSLAGRLATGAASGTAKYVAPGVAAGVLEHAINAPAKPTAPAASEDPQVPGMAPTASPATSSGTPNWVLPAALGAGALGLGALALSGGDDEKKKRISGSIEPSTAGYQKAAATMTKTDSKETLMQKRSNAFMFGQLKSLAKRAGAGALFERGIEQVPHLVEDAEADMPKATELVPKATAMVPAAGGVAASAPSFGAPATAPGKSFARQAGEFVGANKGTIAAGAAAPVVAGAAYLAGSGEADADNAAVQAKADEAAAAKEKGGLFGTGVSPQTAAGIGGGALLGGGLGMLAGDDEDKKRNALIGALAGGALGGAGMHYFGGGSSPASAGAPPTAAPAPAAKIASVKTATFKGIAIPASLLLKCASAPRTQGKLVASKK